MPVFPFTQRRQSTPSISSCCSFERNLNKSHSSTMGRKKAFKTPSSPDPPDDPTKPAHRRAIRLQTVLIASDSPPGSQPQGKFDVEHTDDEGLHFVGYRGGEEWYQDTRAELNFCVCKAITKNELDAEKHGLIRCSNRDVSTE